MYTKNLGYSVSDSAITVKIWKIVISENPNTYNT